MAEENPYRSPLIPAARISPETPRKATFDQPLHAAGCVIQFAGWLLLICGTFKIVMIWVALPLGMAMLVLPAVATVWWLQRKRRLSSVVKAGDQSIDKV